MAKIKINMEKEKKFVWGQYFTKRLIVDKVLDLFLKYHALRKDATILEPSSGTGNFINSLKDKGFSNVTSCEIDSTLTKDPCDFFTFSIKEKFDLIAGNPPFTKYNVKNSYYYPEKYTQSQIEPKQYLPKSLEQKDKTQIENAFILKSIKHLKEDGSIAFVLPISFFIAKKNKEVKKEIVNNFSTIVIYQNDKNWFEEPIPCCFAIFTNNSQYKNKIVLLYEDGGNVEEILDKSKLLEEELIPKSFLYKKNNHQEGIPLSDYFSIEKAKYNRDYNNNNVSGANILERVKIPENKNVEDYCLAVVRVGNSSVGKTGLINIKEDILNDMFYVLGFKKEFNKDKKLKEKICSLINENQEHLRSSTFRVGSKSIKKEDIFNLRFLEVSI
jgi:hypothetical protein